MKKLTINDIAKIANVSKTTVSFYLNGKLDKMSDETKNRIKNVIDETGYQPSLVARSLSSKNNKLIGVIIGDITNSFSNQIVKGIDCITSEKKYQIIVGNSNYNYENEEKYIERMLAMDVNGFIVQPSLKFDKIISKLEDLNKKLVFVDSQSASFKGVLVKTNNYEITYNATVECIKKGYENFIMVSADPKVLSTREERISAYRQALIDYNKEYISKIVDSNVQPNTILNFVIKNIRLDKKTLIFVVNCWLFPIVFLALRQYKDLMPNNIGLIGFDNTEWTNLSYPTLTTIVQPAYEEGKKAAKVLIDLIEGEKLIKKTHTLKCAVNWCESTNLKCINIEPYILEM